MSEHDGVVELTRRLVAARSDATVGEQQAVEVARVAMVKLGYQGVTIDPLGNLTGSMPGSGGTGCVVLDGHADTVGVGDSSAWASDPYAMEQRGTRLYGRGVSDMKGSIAAMIYGVARLKDDPVACDVVVSVSVAEELVEGYALGHVLDRFVPKAVVIGESTSMALARAQRGRAEVLVETFGVPAHSSTPQLGRNAIKPMATLVNLLSNLPMPADDLLGPAILEVTDIISHPYPALSVIPEHCMATFDRRMLVEETEEDVLAEVQAILDAYVQDDPSLDARASIAVDRFNTYTGFQVEAPNCAPAWRMADDASIVQAGIEALTHAGLLPILSHYGFCTNGSESAGRRGIPTIGFGPGDEAEAHRIDESLEVSHLFAAVTGYEMLARELAKL
ncbi:MAG: YgeY family selenium metabolism-linked hydrolase [Chloroflexota bacterium]|nr:YgeY family selenium metabolism-linked hydrolase [Chloroflexota bacterium]